MTLTNSPSIPEILNSAACSGWLRAALQSALFGGHDPVTVAREARVLADALELRAIAAKDGRTQDYYDGVRGKSSNCVGTVGHAQGPVCAESRQEVEKAPACCTFGTANSRGRHGRTQAKTTSSGAIARIHALFAVVVLLLGADLHSSWSVPAAAWEANPFINALADVASARPALVAVKAIDVMCLAVLYAIWKRADCDRTVALLLLGATLVYAPIVIANYHA